MGSRKTSRKRSLDLMASGMEIDGEGAFEADELGFMSRSMVQATMPHRKVEGTHHIRRNGDYTLTMIARNPEVGLPFGSVPRLMLAWIGAEAVRTKNKHLILGESMSKFMVELGLARTGGPRGGITRLKYQSRRLFGCIITCDSANSSCEIINESFGLGKAMLWWEPRDPDRLGIYQSTLDLSTEFFDEIMAAPVPVDMRALRALKGSPMALDLYAWLTYRMFSIRKPVVIPWGGLQRQFGAGYPETPQGGRNFRKSLLQHLRAVLCVYPDAKVTPVDAGLLLKPSPTHVSKRPRTPIIKPPG